MKFKDSLGKQLLFWILLSSSILTLVITCLHFYVDYKNDISAIDARLHQIEHSYIPTISNALWVEDEAQLEVQITGIKNLPEVILVQLLQNNDVRFSQGVNDSEYTREGRWPILYSFDGNQMQLGSLYVVTDLLPVYRRLGEKALLTLATQGAKTFIISFVIFFIVYYFIARHISHIAHAMANFKLDNDDHQPLVLNRNTKLNDELSYLVDEHNKMKQDIASAFKEIEKQRSKAEEVNRLKSEFLANISHEVKTPMNGVYGMAHLLANSKLSGEQKDYVNVIIRSAEHMLELLNSILDFSKIEANRLELCCQPIDLSGLIEDIVLTFKADASAKAIDFKYQVDPNIDHQIVADPVRLKQILVNLLSNAFKFTDKGSIELSARLCQSQINTTLPQTSNIQSNNDEKSTEMQHIYFEVRDTGKGIATEKQEVIFDKFTQEDNSTTRHYGGTGLGLAISQHLVKLMGGELKLRSEAGQGCTFYFTAPFTITDLPVNGEGIDQSSLVSLKVLIIDDHEFNTRIMAETLAGWSMRTVTINNPKLAIFECQSQDNINDGFDFILVDKCMPEIDGYDLVRQIVQLRLIKTPKIILTSAHAEEEDYAKCKGLGIDAFIPLPANQNHILQTLLGLADNQSELGSKDEKSDPLQEPDTACDGKAPCILIVEDSPINQQICVTILKRCHYNILVANNGEEAVNLWRSNQIDLIIMDCHMPVMNGFEATKKIRVLEANRDETTPIIAVTASDTDLDKQKCFDAGMNAFVSKPFVPKHLIAVIKKYMERSDEAVSV